MSRHASVRFTDDDWAWLENQCLNGECGLSEIMRRMIHRLRDIEWNQNAQTGSLSEEKPQRVLRVRVREPEKFVVTE